MKLLKKLSQLMMRAFLAVVLIACMPEEKSHWLTLNKFFYNFKLSI